MTTLSEQQKDARERILVMALMSGLTASDLTSIGGKLKRQQERAVIVSLSQQLHQMEVVSVTEDSMVVKHNSKTVTATKIPSKNGNRQWHERDRYAVKVVGPKGGIKDMGNQNLRNWDIERWPLKLMVNRNLNLTVLLHQILEGTIPTK
jgi:hypothetical protein